MTGLVLKDMLVMRKTLKTYVLFLAFYLLLAVIGLFPISTITAVTQIIIMMLPLSAFSFDELAKWDRYALTFPTGRRSLVGARYLFTLVMVAAATLYSLVACVVLSIGKGQSAMAENLLSLMVSLGLGLIIADILLPLCYKLGVERARPYMYIVIFAPLLLFFGAYKLGLFEGIDLSSLDRMPESTVLAVGSLLPLIPLLGLGLSYHISCRIKEQKVWTGCLVSITLSVLHFAWIATAVERVLVLALLALAGAFALAHRR